MRDLGSALAKRLASGIRIHEARRQGFTIWASTYICSMIVVSNHHCIYSGFDLIACYEGEAEVEEFLKFQVLARQDT